MKNLSFINRKWWVDWFLLFCWLDELVGVSFPNPLKIWLNRKIFEKTFMNSISMTFYYLKPEWIENLLNSKHVKHLKFRLQPCLLINNVCLECTNQLPTMVGWSEDAAIAAGPHHPRMLESRRGGCSPACTDIWLVFKQRNTVSTTMKCYLFLPNNKLDIVCFGEATVAAGNTWSL